MYSRVFTLLLCTLVATSIGCTKKRSQEEVRSAMPDQGKIRVLFTRVKEQANYTHYKWSFVGDRNWSEPSCTGAAFRVDKSSKLNSPDSRGGCFTWEIDIESTKQESSASWKAKGEIRGSNGRTAKLQISDGPCLVTRSADGMDSVGSDIDLGKVGQAPLSVIFTK